MLRDSWRKWFEDRLRTGRGVPRRRRTQKRLTSTTAWVAQALEDRTLLTTFTVDNLVDESDGNFGAGDLSLREAIEQANANPGADIVNFVPALNGGVFNLALGSLNISDDLTLNGNAATPMILNGGGIVLQSNGPLDSLLVTIDGISVNNNVNGSGLFLEAINDGTITALVSNGFFNNSAREGVKFRAHTGGRITLTMNNVTAASNGDSVASPGIDGEIGVGIQAQSLNTPGKFATVRVNFNNVKSVNNPLEGFDLDVASGGIFETVVPIRNSMFSGNGLASIRNELDFVATGTGSQMTATFQDSTADNARGNAFNFVGLAGAKLAIGLTNVSAMNAGADAFELRTNGAGTTAAVSVDGLMGDNAGLFGADFNIENGSEVRVNNFNNVTLQNSQRSGIDVFALNSTLANFNSTTANLSGNAINGLNLFVRNSGATFNFTDITANNNVQRGVQINSIVGAVSSLTLNNVSATGNQTKQPLNFIASNNATLNLDVNGGTVSSAGTAANNSIFGSVDLNSIGNLSFDGLAVNNSTASAFVTRYDRNSTGTYEIKNTSATGSQLVGSALFIRRGAQVTGNFEDLDVSNSGLGAAADAFRITVENVGSRGVFDVDGLTANNSSRIGANILYFDQATGAFTSFDNVSATQARQDGILFDVRSGARITSLAGNTINTTGAGQGGSPSADGLNLSVAGMNTVGNFSLQNVTANNARGRGIFVDVQNMGARADVELDTFSANNNRLEGVLVQVGTVVSGARLTPSTFKNGTANSNGAGLAADGVRTRVTGVGNVADITFDNVDANNNGLRGFDMLANGGANFTVALNNGSSANSNFFDGVLFNADGPTTEVALKSNVGGSTFDTNGDAGMVVNLTNGVTATDVTVLGSASTNGEDGLIIRADDATGSTINNLAVSGVGTAFVDNTGTGLIIDLDGVLGLSTLDLSNMSVTGNMGVDNLTGVAGIEVDLANMTLDSITANNLSVLSNTGGTGASFDLSSITVNTAFDLTGFLANSNGGGGVDVNIRNASQVASLTVDGSANNNGGDGFSIVANDATGTTINNLQISGTALTLNNNVGNGLTVDFDSVLGVNSFDLSSMTVNGNTGDQVFARFAGMTLDTVSLNDINAIGPGAAGGTGDGVDLVLDGTTVTTSLALNRINASSNGEDGLQLSLLNGASIPASSIDVGEFITNGQHGVNLNLTGSAASIDITNSTFDLLGTVASASNNGGNGINVLLSNADLTMTSIDHLTLNGNAGGGFNVQGAVNSNFASGGSFTNNTVMNNGSFGYRGIFNGGTFDVSIGSRTTPGLGNVFDGNTGAGIAVDMLQDAMGRVAILDNQIINTADDNNPGTQFAGDGIIVRMLGTANPLQATNRLFDAGGGPGLLIDNNILGGLDAMGTPQGNAGFGLTFQVEEESRIDGLHVHDNNVSNSGVDGLNFRRFDAVIINDFEVFRNTFNDGGDDGIEITGENDDDSFMEVTIEDSEMQRNGNDGAAFQVNAEAKLRINMARNLMVQNGDDGIQNSEVILDPTDSRGIFGVWDEITVADNGDRGIESSSVLGNVVTAERLVVQNSIVGQVLDEFNQVLFQGNASTGLELNGAGLSTWMNNDFVGNGHAVVNNNAVGHGIDIQGATFKDVILIENQIRENFEDGIEFNNDNGVRGQFLLEMVDNRVQNNASRGLDILNERDAVSFITVRKDPNNPLSTGNIFSSNGQEGVYAVNTSSGAQAQDNTAADTLATDGNVSETGNLSLILDFTTISNNGSPPNVGGMVDSGGLVVRVGTAEQDATQGIPGVPYQGGFATNGAGTPAIIDQAIFPTFLNAGVFLQLTSSTLLGNFGNDVFIHGYTSTVDPTTIGGTWDTMMFAPQGGQGDPLARLDLKFGTPTGANANTFDALNLNNGAREGTPTGEAGAFYSDSDGTFKSRLGNAMPPGPFGNNAAARRRNAQRLPARTYNGGFMLGPAVSPDGGRFLFPGMGDSTFRVQTAGDTGVAADLSFLLGTGGFGFSFLLDDNPVGGDFSPIEGPGEAFGVSFTGNVMFGEQPFGWGQF
jgi:hypothetical protein